MLNRILGVAIAAIALLASSHALAVPPIAEGAFRVDWNRKVRDLCVDVFTNEDLSARNVGQSLRQL